MHRPIVAETTKVISNATVFGTYVVPNEPRRLAVSVKRIQTLNETHPPRTVCICLLEKTVSKAGKSGYVKDVMENTTVVETADFTIQAFQPTPPFASLTVMSNNTFQAQTAVWSHLAGYGFPVGC